jgi:hypothetical protein
LRVYPEVSNKVSMLITRGSKREALDKDDGAEAQPRGKMKVLSVAYLCPTSSADGPFPPPSGLNPGQSACCSNTNARDGAAGEIEGGVDLEMQRPAAGVGALRQSVILEAIKRPLMMRNPQRTNRQEETPRGAHRST